MITRRELLQVGAATAALAAGGGFTRAMAQQRLSEAQLLKFDALGNVTLLHVADIDRKSTRLNSSHLGISYPVFCLKTNNDQSGGRQHGDSIGTTVSSAAVGIAQ